MKSILLEDFTAFLTFTVLISHGDMYWVSKLLIKPYWLSYIFNMVSQAFFRKNDGHFAFKGFADQQSISY